MKREADSFSFCSLSTRWLSNCCKGSIMIRKSQLSLPRVLFGLIIFAKSL